VTLALTLTMGDGVLLWLTGRTGVWRLSGRLGVAELTRSTRLLVIQLAHFAQFRIGTIVLAALGSTVAVGEYTIASRLTEGLIVLAMALSSSSLPLMGAAHAYNERANLTRVFERSYGVGTRMVAPLVAGLVLAAPVWVEGLFPRYPDAGPPAAVVGLAVAIFFASSQTTVLLNATHRDRTASRSAFAGLAVSVLASFLLGPFGAIGVAWARVAGELTRFAVEAAASVRDVGVRIQALAMPWIAVSPVLTGAAIAVATGWQRPFLWAAIAIVVLGSLPLVAAIRAAAERST
jgi:O-antigen/teichoic acid export membrane protein